MEVVLYAIPIVAVVLFLRLLQETIARKNAIDSLDRVNKSLGDLMVEHITARTERDEAIAERNAVTDALVTITKERDELQARLCKIKDNDIELLNLKIYKERVLARLRSIIDDEVDESFHS